MKITWQIDKKRGHHRPTLSYKIELEDFERELAIPRMNMKSTIPKLSGHHTSYCLPGEDERSQTWHPHDFHMISVPFFKEGELQEHLRLPFREDGQYPEIEQSFLQLRERYEELVREAYGHGPVHTIGELDLSDHTRQSIAATLTAQKMLNLSM